MRSFAYCSGVTGCFASPVCVTFGAAFVVPPAGSGWEVGAGRGPLGADVGWCSPAGDPGPDVAGPDTAGGVAGFPPRGPRTGGVGEGGGMRENVALHFRGPAILVSPLILEQSPVNPSKLNPSSGNGLRLAICPSG